MKNLFTHCPQCRGQFYASEEKREGDKVSATCPYCGWNYKDVWDEQRVKETRYYWELYSGLYPYAAAEKKGGSHLKIGSVFLSMTLVLFAAGFVSVFLLEDFAVIRGGVGLAGTMFIFIQVLGTFNAYKARSFVVALTGAIFAVLNSMLWSVLNFDKTFLVIGVLPSSLYLFFGLIFSLTALVLIVKNRKKFRYGY